MVHVPVHGQCAATKQLGAVHADVVAGGLGLADVFGVNGVHAREGDVAAPARGDVGLIGRGAEVDARDVAIQRPALDDRQFKEIDIPPRANDFLAAAPGNKAGSDAQQRPELARLGDDLGETRGGMRAGERSDAVGDEFETGPVRAAQRTFHAPVRAEGIDRHGKARADKTAGEGRLGIGNLGMLKEQRGSAERGVIGIAARAGDAQGGSG